VCGINGILYFDSNEPAKQSSYLENEIKAMNDEIRHRGPDNEGIFISYPLCLGFRRLSILDLSEKANQPMFNEDKSVVIVFNGEIYNYPELIPELKAKGHKFVTRSDTEVILHAYEEYGTDCVNKFNGMWAFVIFDFNKKIFFASRDRFGVKPFYYYANKERFTFSSEIKAILKTAKLNDAHTGKVFDYLSYGYKTSNGDTFFKDVRELLPGHNLVIEKNRIRFEKYWTLKNQGFSGSDTHEQLRELLYDAVRIRYRSDVPVAILLSGGLDSSIIAKITDELINEGKIENDVTAFSAVFPGFLHDESGYIDEFVKTCAHINSVRITPGSNDFLKEIDDFVYGMGEPVFSATSFAHYILMKEIKKHNVKVVMNGQGSDEAWCGYGRYFIGYFLLDTLLNSPQKFYSQYSAISSKMRYSYKYILFQTIKAMFSRKSVSHYRAARKEKTFSVLNGNFINENKNYFINPEYNRFSGKNLSGYMKYNIQYQGFNQILHYEDHSSMQSSIEMRSPFVDYRIMELAFAIPDRMKIDNGVTKKILREIFSEKLPSSIVNNHDKTGFVTPFDDWLNEDKFRGFVEKVFNPSEIKCKRILNADKLAEYVRDNPRHKQFPFWRFINLELWARKYDINNL